MKSGRMMKELVKGKRSDEERADGKRKSRWMEKGQMEGKRADEECMNDPVSHELVSVV